MSPHNNSAPQPFDRLSPSSPPRSLSAIRVLVIDNDSASTRMVRLMLERRTGCEICEVNDPFQAVAEALRFKPDLILLDIEMPGIDGGAVAAMLQANELIHAPIVFITGLVTEDEAESSIFTAGSRVLAKPLTAGKLTRYVAELLSAALADLSPAAKQERGTLPSPRLHVL